jgi:RNA recognition motif-containing protein
MQEIAEASVESILTSIDSSESMNTAPETPPIKDGHRDWFSPSGGSTPFSKPSWSFVDSAAELTNRQFSSSVYSTSDESSFQSDGGPGLCTTVMLRNIPNKYSRAGLLSALVERGFDPNVDCNNLYLPMDASSGCNLGYAFLNFTTHDKALSFMKQFDGVRLPSAGSRKVCSVVWANKQGVFQHTNPPTSKEQTVPGGAPMQIQGERVPTCKIFVGGLATSTSEDDLVEYFSQFGTVKEVTVVMNRSTGASRGFGFCEFTSPDAVDMVLLAESKKPHSISCRVVSVRPYNSTQLCMEPNQCMPTAQPQTMTFLMGNGVIHCPSQPPLSTWGSTSTYSHPLLSTNPVMNAQSYGEPQFHSFFSY